MNDEQPDNTNSAYGGSPWAYVEKAPSIIEGDKSPKWEWTPVGNFEVMSYRGISRPPWWGHRLMQRICFGFKWRKMRESFVQ